MTVDVQLRRIGSLKGDAYEPYGTEDVVGVSMSNKEVAKRAAVDMGALQLSEYAIASSRVDKQPGASAALEDKACIETVGYEGVARTKHCDGLWGCCHMARWCLDYGLWCLKDGVQGVRPGFRLEG